LRSRTRHIPFLSYLVIALILYSCAQIVSPSGGPKDKTPPRAVRYVPDSAAVNFKGRNITIYFNEFIQLKDLTGQLIISPPLAKQPVVKIQGKSLRVEFQEPLRDSSTYCMNFGNSIADITEGNAMDNFRYVFSTGAYIDSLSVKGKVETAFDHKTEKGILVMLYNTFNDSIPLKKIPAYFAKTKEDGSFKINNVKKGRYKVFALKDVNANYLYDTPEESIGFMDSTLNLRKDTSIRISLFQEKLKKQFLRKSRAVEYNHLVFIFNKAVENIEIVPLNFKAKKDWRIDEYSANRDTLNCWLTDGGDLDTLKLRVSDNGRVLDTVKIKTIGKEPATTDKKKSKWALRVKTNITGGPVDMDNPIRLEFSHPLAELYDKKNISLKEDSLELKKEMFWKDDVLRKIEITTRISNNLPAGTKAKTPVKTELWKENTLYHLFIPPKTFTDVYGLTNDTIKVDFKTQELKNYGTLKLKVSVPKTAKHYLVQLTDEKGGLVRENRIEGSETINYEFLHPQKYIIKLVYDTNKNGRWDTGDYFKNQQPEKTIFYPGAIDIRSNWDLEQEWKVE